MSEAIWKRVYRCAQELTRQGMTPFTRGDLIRCVQRSDPDCNPDSINPIIQGMTDNLRGGAPGAVGKDLLHSVGRGQFILRKDACIASSECQRGTATDSIPGEARPHQEKSGKTQRPLPQTGRDIRIGEYVFRYICDIEPERDADGGIRRFTPQDRYNNHAALPLNTYGAGPFCKFKIPWNIPHSGVYAIVANDRVQYVGECENLSARFNMGYGSISPRNCFKGGQETNCRINSLVLDAADSGLRVALFFCETDDYKRVESDLRGQELFAWNRA